MKFVNNNLNKLIHIKLNKSLDLDITKRDINEIKDITLINEDNNDLSDISLFHHIDNLSIKNYNINHDNYKNLRGRVINQIQFLNTNFLVESKNIIACKKLILENVKSIEHINFFNFFKDVTHLSIIQNNLNLNDLVKYKKLKKIYLKNVDIKDLQLISNFKMLDTIILDDCNIQDYLIKDTNIINFITPNIKNIIIAEDDLSDYDIIRIKDTFDTYIHKNHIDNIHIEIINTLKGNTLKFNQLMI